MENVVCARQPREEGYIFSLFVQTTQTCMRKSIIPPHLFIGPHKMRMLYVVLNLLCT